MSAENITIPKKRKQAEKPIFINCINCGKPFLVYVGRLLRRGRKFCSRACHYSYAARKKSDEEKFWDKVHKTDGCWIWTGAKRTPKNPGSYGKFATGGHKKQTNYAAHRYAWILKNGPIPDGFCVLHKCDNRLCVNPDHLFIGTQQDNADDMVSKGRSRRGGNHPHARLSESTVRRIKDAFKEGQSCISLANEFMVRYVTVQAIIHNRTWKHI